MASESSATAVLEQVDEAERTAQPTASPLVGTAALEFQAALQLLVERARFLTGADGVSAALREEQGQFVYSAANGELANETGTAADVSKPFLHECVSEKKAVERKLVNWRDGADAAFGLVVPILRDDKVAGFLELRRGPKFEKWDGEQVQRIAGLIGTAIDHREAAVQAQSLAFDEVCEIPSAPVAPTWHAPAAFRAPEGPSSQGPHGEAALSVPVQKCRSCGFPVSAGRKLCIDCEMKTDHPQVPAELFSSPHHQSWISGHGYTIASVLVSLLAILVIVWLRSR